MIRSQSNLHAAPTGDDLDVARTIAAAQSSRLILNAFADIFLADGRGQTQRRIPKQGAHRKAETGRSASPFLTMDDTASRLHKSRRWLQDWLRNHPVDRNGEPFYTPLGRTKIFDERDIQRIRDALKEEARCRLNSSRRGQAKRPIGRSAALISGDMLTEALRLASARSPQKCSVNSNGPSNVVSLPSLRKRRS